MARRGRRFKVSVNSPTQAQSATGRSKPSFALVQTEWASVESLQGTERLVAQQINPETTVKVRLPYSATNSALDSTWQIVHGSRTFEVVSAINLGERNRTWELMCKEA